VHQPGNVDRPVEAARQHHENPPVELPAAQDGQGSLDRPPKQLVAIPDRVIADNEQPRRHRRVDRRGWQAQRPLQQPDLGPGRYHGDDL